MKHETTLTTLLSATATALLLAVLFVGCAPVVKQNPAVVQIGSKPASSCERMGTVRCSAWSKPELANDIKVQAAEMGANFVEVSSIVQGSEGFEAKGVAFLCK